MDENESNKTEDKKSTFKEEAISFLKTLVVLIVIAIFLRASVVEAYRIPSGSMKPTLQIGDHILVSKLSFGLRLPFISKILWQYDTPDRHDVVVFTRVDDPKTMENESADNIIKRVIGIAGDVIEVKRNKLFVNGKLQEESFARWVHGGDPIGNFGPVKVPEGKILLLGDNRDQSRDSRFWHDPFLPVERLKGRAMIIYWSWADLGRIGTLIK